MRILIAPKIIIITTLIVLISMSLLTYQTSDYFYKEMLQKEEYSNFSEANLLGKQVETLLDSGLDKAKSIGQSLVKESPDGLVNFKMSKDKYLMGLQIWQVIDGQPQLLTQKYQSDFLEKYKLTENLINEAKRKKPFPLAKLVQKSIETQFQDINPELNLFSIGFPLSQGANGQVTFICVADFKSEMLQSLFSNENDREFYLVDREGSLLAHQIEGELKKDLDYSKDTLVAKALADGLARKQFSFLDQIDHKNYIGTFVKSSFWKTTLLAKTPLSLIAEPAQAVKRKAILISGVIMSISLFIVFLFSLTISRPIEILARLIQEVPKGNFNLSARKKIKSNDEVGDLAKAIDHMTEGLRERDKVKNLFNKFHGSSITEHLLNKEIGVGGSRKDVTVFFSDIRGFTKFSEGHSPEEVVEMLNEYFGEMVAIINRHGGIVDKFIGDAIMAVWGVPQGHDDDTAKAMAACLAMRETLLKLNKSRLSRGLTEIKIGMGLHAGPAISGTIGSEERMEITVIGDTVNVTSRIESSTKDFEVDLLVSDEVHRRLSTLSDENGVRTFKFELAGDIEVKGKSLPLTLYTIKPTT